MAYRILTLLLLLVILNRAQAQQDSIFLNNGQILIGELKGGQYGEITIDDIDLKMVQVKLYKVRRLTTSRKFRIEMNDKKVYFGTIRPADKAGSVKIFPENGEPVLYQMQDMTMVVPLEKNFFTRLSGNLSAGFSYTKSSAEGQTNINSVINYRTELFEYQLSASSNGSIDSTGFSRDREDVGLFAAYSFSATWFAAANVKYERNLELSIARRYQEMIGGGNKVLVRKNSQLLVLSGITFNQERSTSGENSDLLLEIPVGFLFNFFKYRHPNIQITATQSIFFSLSQKGRIRYSGNTNFSWELVRYFYLTFGPYSNYDNQPPQGTSTFDYGAALSLSYKF